MNLVELFTSIADAIRTKKGTTDKIKAEDFPTEIEKIEGGAEVYYSSANGRCYIEDVVIPETVELIGDYAYENCGNLKTVTIYDGATSIGRAVFRGDSGMQKLTISSTVTSIGAAAFTGCSGLTEVVLGKDFNSSGATFSAGKYSVDVMVAMFEALKDNTGETAKTLTLGTTNLNKLTDEQKAIATNKNWNLA